MKNPIAKAHQKRRGAGGGAHGKCGRRQERHAIRRALARGGE